MTGMPQFPDGTRLLQFDSRSRPGYSLSDYDSRAIEISGIGAEKYNQVISSLRSKGFDFDATDYSRASGAGGVGKISNIRMAKASGGTRTVGPGKAASAPVDQ